MSSTTVTRAEHLGSFLRSEELKRARSAHEAGRLSHSEFKRVEDGEVDRAISLQEAIGFGVLTDGELRRAHFSGSLSEAVHGFAEVPAGAIQWHGSTVADEMTLTHRRAITGRLKRARSLAQEEFVYLRARSDARVKATLPSPLMMQTYWSQEHSTAAYADAFEMFADAAALLREEVADLAELGCDYVQIDAPELAMLVDESARAGFRSRGIDPERMLGEGIEILNGVTGAPGVHFALHLCRGNREGHWAAAGGYEAIAKEVFQRARGFETWFLEYDDERSGDFEPLRELPSDAFVFLGLVSTKRPALEDPAELLARIDEAAGYFPRDQLGLSPQCGFASTLPGNPLSFEEQEAKLRLVMDVAARAWPG